MPYDYPRELVFGLAADDPRRAAIVLAANELQLPVRSEVGGTTHVTVDSPMTAYRYGLATRKYLKAGHGAPPLPAQPMTGASST